VYVITLDKEVDRDAVVEALGKREIPCRCYFSPVHLQSYILGRNDCRIGELPVTESIARRTLALPFHSRLLPSQVDEVVDALHEVVAGVHAKS
ncbi:MAG: DegT/DnrJ/EryC1/StrS family aminotransferase, partial [Candidatus Acidiferrales bacterium]